MSSSRAFLDEALAADLAFWSSVPCSLLGGVLNGLDADKRFVHRAATSEGEAVAIAAGAALAGKNAGVLMQNSGLGNAVNPLASLCHPFGIPIYLLIGHREAPDEPQHLLMGEITAELLRALKLEVGGGMQRSDHCRARLIKRGELDFKEQPAALAPGATGVLSGEFTQTTLRRMDVLRFLADSCASSPIVATTGHTGRELFYTVDRPNHFYMVGSMGCASGIGLGIHEALRRRVIVIDGDGALLMKLGSLATIGRYQPAELVHIVLDNGAHDSTGGQASARVDFASLAHGCGYKRSVRADTLHALEAELTAEGPVFVHLRIKPGSQDGLGRPTVTPKEVRARFSEWLAR